MRFFFIKKRNVINTFLNKNKNIRLNFNLHNFVLNNSGRCFNYGYFTDFFIHNSRTDRGGVADQSVQRIAISVSYNFIFKRLIGLCIHNSNGTTDAYFICVNFFRVDDFSGF